MKKILIPYDFSKPSENALEYALGFAKNFGSELLLLHVNQYPVVSPEVGLSAYVYFDAKEDSIEELKKIAEKVKAREPSITKIECYSEMGDTANEILAYAKDHAVDVTIMGISGHGNDLMKSLIGSVAVAVSKQSEGPIIIVPPNVKYSKPRSIAYACNYDDGAENKSVLKHAKQIAAGFGADLHILHVLPEHHHFAHTEVLVDNYTEHKLESSAHRTFFLTEKKASEGLLDVIKSNLADLVILEPKKHNFFYNLFHESVTKEVAFKSTVPVMTLHS
jgi:nucleotide-binding universal stress UspA family protein